MLRARAAAVGDAHAPELDVVLGRDDDLGVRVDAEVAAAELGAALGEDRLVAVGLPERRLVRRRPELAAGGVAQVDEAAPGVAGGVLAPARHRQVLPAAVAAAGLRDHDVVAAVRQQLHLGRRRVGRGDDADRHLGGVGAARARRCARRSAGGSSATAGSSPAAAAAWRAAAGRPRSAAASARRAAAAPARAAPCPGGAPCTTSPARSTARAAAATACSRSPRGSRTRRARPAPAAAAGWRRPPTARTAAPSPRRRARRPGRRRGRA